MITKELPVPVTLGVGCSTCGKDSEGVTILWDDEMAEILMVIDAHCHDHRAEAERESKALYGPR